MSGLFGYYDPENELPPQTAEEMAQPMGCPSDRTTTILRGPTFAIGCISKGIYLGEGEIIPTEDAPRRGLFTGRLLGFSAEAESKDPISTARKAFIDDASPACLASTNGPFAAAVWDENHQKLELITDRYGLYPIYIARFRSATLFAGQIKALLAPGIIPVQWDPIAVSLMLSIGELVGDHTLLKSVRVLPAGSKVTFTDNSVSNTRYWQYAFCETETDFDGIARLSGERLRTAVGRVCDSSPSVGVPLSGGLDSRVLLASTPNAQQVPSFTWGLPGCRDLRYGTAAARVVGSPHVGFEYEGGYLEGLAALGVWITEGQLPCTDFHVLPYVEQVGERCDVILNGYAGDVVLGGNFIRSEWWKAADRQQAGAALWKWRDTVINSSYRSSLWGQNLEGCSISDAQDCFIRAYRHSGDGSVMDAANAFLFDNRVRRRTSCGTSLMRWRVESDQPFFDNDLFEIAARMPNGWRSRHRLYTQMLRTCFPQVARVPWQRTALPASSPRWLMYLSLGIHRLDRYRPFKAFFRSRKVSDFDGWMRGPLRLFIRGLLNEPRTLERGLWDADTLRRIVHDHMVCGIDNSSLLGAVIALELFGRLFIDRDVALIKRCKVLAPNPKIFDSLGVQ